MRPADDIALRIGSRAVSLRVSLRAATLLERRYDGFDKLLSKVADGHLGTISDVVSVSAGETDLLDRIGDRPLGDVMPGLIDAASRHVLALVGFDADNPEPAQRSGKRISYAEYHGWLFKIATGWLGWTPAEAWAAAPNEIVEAYSGHVDMLRTLHGGAETDQSTPDKPGNAELDSEGLHALKGLGRYA